jgi:hypothetical protein
MMGLALSALQSLQIAEAFTLYELFKKFDKSSGLEGITKSAAIAPTISRCAAPIAGTSCSSRMVPDLFSYDFPHRDVHHSLWNSGR